MKVLKNGELFSYYIQAKPSDILAVFMYKNWM